MSVSLYIPRVRVEYSEDFIKQVMERNYIGVVSHVDFAPVNQKPGFHETYDSPFMSAFVHFSCISTPDYGVNVKFWDGIMENYPCKLQVGEYEKEYWLCLKNKNPIQRTKMNIHQVVENSRYLENIIQDQSRTIEKLEQKLERVHESVCQLLGGLFCQTKQK
jgi:hypothetical protein